MPNIVNVYFIYLLIWFRPQISPNVLYEIFMPANEQLSGCPSQLTIAMMEEKVLAWNETNPQSGMQQFLDQQTVPDKTVSDCVEALIGVYLIVSLSEKNSTNDNLTTKLCIFAFFFRAWDW